MLFLRGSGFFILSLQKYIDQAKFKEVHDINKTKEMVFRLGFLRFTGKEDLKIIVWKNRN